MGIKFNPLIFSGLDFTGAGGVQYMKAPVADISLLPLVGNSDGDARITLDTDKIWVWDATSSRWVDSGLNASAVVGSTPNSIGYSLVLDDSVANVRTRELVLQPADSSNPGIVSTTFQNFAGNKTFDNDVIISGDLTVNGTTTTINTTNLEVTDKNILINNNGNDISAEGAGLTIERTGTNGSLVYENALTSKFKAGDLGAEVELADISSTQNITNKNLKSSTNLISAASTDNFTRETGNQQVVTIPDTTIPDNFVLEDFTQTLNNKSIDADLNTITNIKDADIKTGAAIDATKIADGSVDNTEFQYLDGASGNIQSQLDDRVVGPATSTNNAIPRFDLTTGKLIQDSTATIDDSGNLDIQGDITVTGTVDGVDVAALESDVNGFPDELKNLTATEINQLENINSNAISSIQWGYLSGLDQPLSTTSAASFTGVYAGDLSLFSNSLVSSGTNQNIQIAPNGTGNIDATSSKIINVLDPTNNQDAATKKYVDDNTSFVTGDIKQTSFSLSQSQTDANITGLTFTNAVTRAAKVQYSVVINATSSLYETGTLELVQRGSDWTIAREFSGDDSLIDFNVDVAGQITYSSPAYTGFVSGLIKFKAYTLEV